MSGPSAIQHVLTAAESAFAENVTTFGTRLPVTGMIDVSTLTREKLAPEFTVDRRNDGTPHIKGKNKVSWSLRGRFPGHGSSTAGTGLTVSTLGAWLGAQVGACTLAHTAGTTFDGTGTTTAPGVDLTSGYAAGSILPLGARGDGGGGGQFYRVLTHATDALNLANAMIGAPVNTAVVRSSEMIYPLETVNTITTYRYQVGTANNRYNIHGGFPRGFTLSGFNPGELPSWEMPMGGAAAYPTTGGAMPTLTAVTQHRPAHVANGSLMFAETGSTVRTTYPIRDFQINYTLGIVEDEGPEGIWDGQTIMSVKRVPDTCTGSFTLDASAASASPFWHAAWEDETKEYQLMLTCNTEDGKGLAISLQRVCLTGDRPAQMDSGGINRIPVNFTAYSGATVTSDLTSAMIVIAMA
jgi:hypothetical protein